MKTHSNVAAVVPGAMFMLEEFIHSSTIDRTLVQLLKARAAQVSGCASCFGMDPNDAHVAQEIEPRFYGLDDWRQAPYYTDRERAALEWTEALTRDTDEHVPHDVYERARRQFSEKELVELGMIAVSLDGWNRLAIAFRSEARTDQPPPQQQQHDRAPARG